ncbi:MAG: glycosyltransferase [Patescibacteria group bacterium]
MKIAIFTDFFLPKVNGVVTSLEQLILELDRRGHEVLVITPAMKGAPKKMGSNIQLFYLPSIPAVIFPDTQFGLLSPRLNRVFGKFAPDVVEIATPANVGIIGIVLAKMHRVPIIGTFHGYFMKPEYLQVVGIKKGVKFVESVGWKYIEFIFRRCQRVISPSESVHQDLLAHNITTPIVVCPNGLNVDTNSFDLKKHNQILKKFHLDPKNTLLYVGRLSKEKSIEKLIQAFYLLQLKLPETRLLLVGDGPDRKNLEQLVHLYDIDKKVVFMGELPHDKLFTLGIFKFGRVFVTCSVSEVQPMSVIEASFYGLPVVAPYSPGMTDLIEDGKNGFLVNSKLIEEYVERLTTLLTKEKLYQQFSKHALKKSEQFTVKYSADRYLEVFEQVVKIKR